MAHRLHSCRTIGLISSIGLALAIGFALEPVAGADCPGCRNADCPNCPVNSKYFGYYPTQWRRWPGTEPQTQPTVPPPSEGIGVPPVEPPPSTEETENKAKQSPSDAGKDTGGPAAMPPTEPAAGGPGDMPPGDDPNAKRTNPQPPEKGAAPPPLEAPQKLNQSPPRWNGTSAQAFSDTPPARAVPPGSQTWPPTNLLREQEVRANFQLADGLTLREAAAAPYNSPSDFPQRVPTGAPVTSRPRAPETRSSIRPTAIPPATLPPQSFVGPPQKIAPPMTVTPIVARDDQNSVPLPPSASWHPDVGPSTSSSSGFVSRLDLAAPVGATLPPSSQTLHWVDPAVPAAISGEADRQPTTGSMQANPESTRRSFDGSAKPANALTAGNGATNGQKDRFAAATQDTAHPAAINRIPFMPSASLRDPLAPISPRSLIEQETVGGMTPVDVPTGRVAPPCKISEISVPTLPKTAANATPQATAKTEQTEQTEQTDLAKIDPVAIGHSLEAAKSFDGASAFSRVVPPKENSPLANSIPSVQVGNGRPTNSDLWPPLRPSSAPTSSPIAATDLPYAMRPAPLTAFPPAPITPALKPLTAAPVVRQLPAPSHSASLIVTDDDTNRSGVQPATCVGPAAPFQASTASWNNPLRGASSPSAEVPTADGSSAPWHAAANTPAQAPSSWGNPLRSGN